MNNKILDTELIPSWDFRGCPSDAMLTKFLHEKTDDAMADEIGYHCFACLPCQAVCETILKGNIRKSGRKKTVINHK